MKQFLQVFAFEFKGFVKGKWFLVSSAILCILVSLVMFAPRFIDIFGEDSGENVSQTTDHIGLYDPSGVFQDQSLLQQAFPKATLSIVDDLNTLKTAIKDGSMDTGFYIKDAGSYEYLILDSQLTDTTEYLLESLMNVQYQNKVLHDMGLNADQVSQVLSSQVQGETTILGTDGKQNYFYTYILIFAMYMVIMFYGQMTATNVASEKGNRSMEILVTSTSSNALIFGKVLAGAIAGILQVGVVLGVSMVLYQVNVNAWNHSLDFLLDIPVDVLFTFAVFGTLGYLFYSFIYGALGSMVSKVEDVSSAITPIMIIFIISFFITFFSVMINPGTVLSTVASYLPFTSCMAMFARVAMGTVDTWQVILSAGILALSTIGIGFLSAKLYRYGTLSYGNSFKFKHLFRMIKK